MNTQMVDRGYADGNYLNHCRNCGGKFQGDKGCWSCKGCATSADLIEKLGAKVTHYAQLLDTQNGTPCEQIRHEQEVGRLREALIDARICLVNYSLTESRDRIMICLKTIDGAMNHD